MANDVTLTCRLNKAHMPVLNTQQLVYVLIDAVPGASMAQVQMPLNLSLVLDKSGSMQGKKIQNLREAAKLVVDRLGPQDTISIVAFSDRKYLVAGSQPVTDKGELIAAGTIFATEEALLIFKPDADLRCIRDAHRRFTRPLRLQFKGTGPW